MEVSGGHSTIYTSMYGVVVVELTSRSGFHFSAFAFHSVIRYPNNLRRSIGRWCEVSLPQYLSHHASTSSRRTTAIVLLISNWQGFQKAWGKRNGIHSATLMHKLWPDSYGKDNMILALCPSCLTGCCFALLLVLSGSRLGLRSYYPAS